MNQSRVSIEDNVIYS